MTTSTQQLPSNPALDFANSILEVTNNGLELIEILRDIAEDDETATTNDRIAAANILNDRAFGKSPRQISPKPDPNPEPDPETDDNPEPAEGEVGACPERSRRVTQIDETLNQSLGPPPRAPQPVEAGLKPAQITSQSPEQGDPEPFEPYSIHYIIQQHILAITNNGQTLRDTLLEIARAEDDPRIKPYHRRRAVNLLLERALGTDPNAVRSAVCPDCRQRWTTHACSPAHSEHSPNPDTAEGGRVEDLPSDEERWAAIEADLKQMEEAGILTPDPDAPPIDISMYRMPKDFDYTPYAKEEAASFWAEIDLRIERQKKWPEIEERRRKKLAQIYPSHSDDNGPPDT